MTKANIIRSIRRGHCCVLGEMTLFISIIYSATLVNRTVIGWSRFTRIILVVLVWLRRLLIWSVTSDLHESNQIVVFLMNRHFVLAQVFSLPTSYPNNQSPANPICVQMKSFPEWSAWPAWLTLVSAVVACNLIFLALPPASWSKSAAVIAARI